MKVQGRAFVVALLCYAELTLIGSAQVDDGGDATTALRILGVTVYFVVGFALLVLVIICFRSRTRCCVK